MDGSDEKYRFGLIIWDLLPLLLFLSLHNKASFISLHVLLHLGERFS